MFDLATSGNYKILKSGGLWFPVYIASRNTPPSRLRFARQSLPQQKSYRGWLKSSKKLVSPFLPSSRILPVSAFHPCYFLSAKFITCCPLDMMLARFGHHSFLWSRREVANWRIIYVTMTLLHLRFQMFALRLQGCWCVALPVSIWLLRLNGYRMSSHDLRSLSPTYYPQIPRMVSIMWATFKTYVIGGIT